MFFVFEVLLSTGYCKDNNWLQLGMMQVCDNTIGGLASSNFYCLDDYYY